MRVARPFQVRLGLGAGGLKSVNPLRIGIHTMITDMRYTAAFLAHSTSSTVGVAVRVWVTYREPFGLRRDAARALEHLP